MAPTAGRCERVPDRLRRPQPASLRHARRALRGVVHRAPALRPKGPADRRSDLAVPRPREGPGRAAPDRQGASCRRTGGERAADPWRARRAGRRPRREAARSPSAPSATSSSTAPTPRPRRAFASTGRSRSSQSLDESDQAAVLLRSRRHRLDALRPRGPPALGRRPRPGPHQPGTAHRPDSRGAHRASRSSRASHAARSSTSNRR